MTTLRAVIFDLDDTLYPERDYVLSGFRAVAQWAQRQLGVPFDEGYHRFERLFAEGVRGTTFNRWLRDTGLPQASRVPEMVRVYRCHQPDIRPFEGVPPLLERLELRYLLGLISDGHLQVQRKKWRALGLEAYFSAVVFSDEGGRECWKPSTWPYRQALRRLGCAPDEAVYVGDNLQKDFAGANQLGMGTIYLLRPGGEYADRQATDAESTPLATVSSFAALEALLERWPPR